MLTKELIMNVELFKQKFGFPLSYTPEGMSETMTLSEEETLSLYKKLEDEKYESISQVMLSLDRNLDEFYDKWLDGEK